MAFLQALLVTICAATVTSLAAPTVVQASGPIVTLDKGKFIGTVVNSTNWFLGIPFAQPPFVADVSLPLCPPSLTRPLPTESATCASVIRRRLVLTLARTMLQRSVFRVPNKHQHCPFRTGYLKRLSHTLSSRTTMEPFKMAKTVRGLLSRLPTTQRAILIIVVGLTLNVVAPPHVQQGSKLPVIVVCTV